MEQLQKAAAAVWHAPGRTWAAMLKAADITLWWRFGAVVITTAIVVGLILIIWRGPWTLAVEPQRLDWLGWFGMAAWFVVLVGIVALMDLRLNFRASRSGIEAAMTGEHDDDPPALPAPAPSAAPASPAVDATDGELPVDQRVTL